MLSKSNRKTFWFCEAVAFLVLALSGCLGTGGGSPSLLGRGATPVDEPHPPSPRVPASEPKR